MGSFNIKCGVSGQVIATDDECLIIPIIQQSSFREVAMTFKGSFYKLHGIANNTCYPNCFWGPIGGFITGKYADYGNIVPDNTEENRINLANIFFRLLVSSPVVSQGENPFHDTPFDLKTFIQENAPKFSTRISQLRPLDTCLSTCLSDESLLDELDYAELIKIWNYVEECSSKYRLFCQDRGVLRPVQFMAIHKAAANHLVEIASKAEDWESETYELEPFLKRKLAKLMEELELEEDTREFFLCRRMLNSLNLNMSDGVDNLLNSFKLYELLKLYTTGYISFEEYLNSMRPLMEGVYILKGMHLLNLHFSPIVYAGQDNKNWQGNEFSKFVSVVAKDVTKGRKRRKSF